MALPIVRNSSTEPHLPPTNKEGPVLAIRKKLMVFMGTVFAMALLALPATAFADTTITQQDVDDQKGVYTISGEDTYVLGEDIQGAIKIESRASVTLDLGGHSITTPASATDDTVSIGYGSTIDIKNGSLIQQNPSHTALRLNHGSLVYLAGASIESKNHFCIDVEEGSVYINSGTSCKVTNTEGSDESVVRVSGRSASSGKIYVEGGTLTNEGGTKIASDGDGDSTSRVTVSAGTFSHLPNTTYASGTAALGKSDGTYSVINADDVYPQAKYVVRIKDAPQTVYFAEGAKDQAEAFAKAQGSEVSSVFTVSFCDSDGSKLSGNAYKDQYIIDGDLANKPANPTKAKYKFQCWTLDGATEYNFATPIDKDTTLTASWESTAPVAKIGDKSYSSLQDAIDVVKDGETITLLTDTAETAVVDGGKFTIDLNGNTLTSGTDEGTYGDDCLDVTGPAELTVKNGSIEADDDGIYIVDSNANVTIDDVKISGGADAINASKGTLTVLKGEFDGTGTEGSYGLYCVDSKVTIEDGSFAASLYGIYASGKSNLTINGGTFGSATGEYALELTNGTATINGGTFNNSIETYSTKANLTVNAGTYTDYSPAPFVAEGKVLLQYADHNYKVADPATAKSQAKWVVSSTKGSNAFKAYFLTESDAKAAYDEYLKNDPDATIKAIYHVEFVSKDSTVETRYLEEGEAVGALPAGEEIDGYSFLGWYKDGECADANKLTESSTLTGDVKAVAFWEKNEGGSPDPDPVTPSDPDKVKPSGSDDSDDNGSNGSGNDGNDADGSKQNPKTGDDDLAAVGFAALGSAALAAAVARRRNAE